MRRTTFIVLIAAIAVIAAGAQQYAGLSAIAAIPGIQPGSRLMLMVRGDAAEGKVWGSDIYSADSSIAAAAVHAGILQHGQTGTVTVEVIPGSPGYSGSSRNGVTSLSAGSYRLSFRFVGQTTSGGFQPPGVQQPVQPAQPQPPIIQAPVQPVQPQPPAFSSTRIFAFTDPGTLNRLPDKTPGTSVFFLVTGSTSGSIWGTGIYTIDSNLSAAAVHAEILSPGQKGLVKVNILPGQSSYTGSSRNGVSTANYPAYPASYSVEAARDTGPVTEMSLDPGSMAVYPGAAAGQTLVLWIKGRKSGGSIWGSDVYTSDSALGLAAVHAGVLADGESAPVIVKVLPGQTSYTGSSRNGVSTAGYGAWGLSYSLERPH